MPYSWQIYSPSAATCRNTLHLNQLLLTGVKSVQNLLSHSLALLTGVHVIVVLQAGSPEGSMPEEPFPTVQGPSSMPTSGETSTGGSLVPVVQQARP